MSLGGITGGGPGGGAGGGGAPSGAAGGSLDGEYPDPGVVDDSHAHTAATLPATMAPSAHTHPASDIASGTVATARLGSGTADSSSYLRGDQSWVAVSSGSGDVVGPTSATDNALVRFDATTGKLVQNGAITESDAGALTGATQLDVDNLRLDGNTLSSTDANGNITLAPNGTGVTIIPVIAGSVSAAGKLILRPNTVDSTSYTEIQNGAAGAVIIAFRNALIEPYKNMTGQGNGSSAEIIFASAASQTVATLRPNQSYGGSGIGLAGAHQPDIIANGLEVLRASAATGSVSSGITFFVPVEASTAVAASPNLLSASESNAVFTNEGATAENCHTLPTAAAGYRFTFICQDTDGIKISANTGDTIRNGATVSASAGFIRTATIGNSVTIVSINATEWIVTAIVGAWTVDL